MKAIYAAFAVALVTAVTAGASVIPVDVVGLVNQYDEKVYDNVNNALSLEQVWSAIREDDSGNIVVDLTDVEALLDNTPVDPEDLYGKAYIGPYPFEAKETRFSYKRFRSYGTIDEGHAVLPIGYLFGAKTNSEDWTDEGQVAVRLKLYMAQEGEDRFLGLYDTFVRFRKDGSDFEILPTLVEGPYVGKVHSGTPDSATISFTVSEPVSAAVVLGDGRRFGPDNAAESYEITLDGLEPDTEYAYHIDLGETQSASHIFRTAPKPGEGSIRLAYTGDSREGVGGGMKNHRGLNYDTLERIAALTYLKGAQVFLMGGDLVNGYTSSPEDFRAQLHAWKQAMSGYWHERPVYPALGNHETLLRVYMDEDGDKEVIIDRWPYATDSAEAVFGEAFVNPENGPEPSDSRRPPYSENVYSLQYGPVKAIAFNNNYWYTNNAEEFGGCPEGYILEDQLNWIKAELEEAQANPTVKYVFLYAQEPVFPNGGHVGDAMWYDGDNTVRAAHYTDGKLVPEEKGIIEVRNELVRAIAKCDKVAAVLGSDEHAYYRVLINDEVPVGDMSKDDKDGNNKIDQPYESCSPLEDLANPVWFVTSGGAGAPYYSEEPSPWNTYWKNQPDGGKDSYYYSSQENVILFDADESGVKMTVYNPYGEVIDQVDNLMSVKN